MKTRIIILCGFILIWIFMIGVGIRVYNKQEICKEKLEIELEEELDALKEEIKILRHLNDSLTKTPFIERTKTIDTFLTDLGFRESSGVYDTVSLFGYLGKYQFSKKTIKYLGFNITTEQFLKNPKIQDKVMFAYLKHHKKVLKKYIERYDSAIVNLKINGESKRFVITKSGILAAAHLSGASNVKRFFESGGTKIHKDGLETSMIEYLENFSGYNI